MSLSTVAVIVPQRPALFELGVVNEVFGIDRTDDGVPPIDFRICSERPGEPIQMINGLTMTTSHGLAAAEEADLVVAPAYDYDLPPSDEVLDVFRRAHARGAWVLSVCSGAFLLGQAGLLDGRTCTTHWRHTADLKRNFPHATVDPDVLFVEDDRVITSAGTAAGIDACLHHVRCELGASVANRIARRMVVPPQRDGGQRQYIDLPVPECTADSLTPILTWMREHLAEEQPVKVLAARAAMSERTFARRFAAETGTTPGKWLLAQRLHHARTLLESTDLAVETVATRAGFGSAALLRHHFGAAVGVAPAEYRRTFRTPDMRAG
jgi:AraC family transcriptional activator FtrA